jgi:hypothetical protein
MIIMFQSPVKFDTLALKAANGRPGEGFDPDVDAYADLYCQGEPGSHDPEWAADAEGDLDDNHAVARWTTAMGRYEYYLLGGNGPAAGTGWLYKGARKGFLKGFLKQHLLPAGLGQQGGAKIL